MVEKWLKDLDFKFDVDHYPAGDPANFTHGYCFDCHRYFKIHPAKPSPNKVTDFFRINICDDCRPTCLLRQKRHDLAEEQRKVREKYCKGRISDKSMAKEMAKHNRRMNAIDARIRLIESKSGRVPYRLPDGGIKDKE